MRRIIITGAALAVLVAAGVAYAATFNTYTAGFKFTPTKAGTKAKPSPLTYIETLGAAGTGGHSAAPLTNITTWLYGLQSNGKYFPKCSAAIIDSNHSKWDKSCPKGSLVGQGPVTSLLVPAAVPTSPGAKCNPYLHIYNGGQNKLVFFFVVIPPKYTCATLTTGAAAPYIGTISYKQGYMVTDVPLPPDVSTEAGGLKGVYGSLIHEVLTFPKATKKVHGKTVGETQSVACKGHKRPWKVMFTAQDYPPPGGSGTSATQSVTGSSPCS